VRPPPILSFLGAAGTVTGSRFLLETDGARVLVDCGLFQGLRELRQLNWRPFPVDPATIDVVVLTHAHVDHCGYLPALVRDGFAGRIVCTPWTADLAGIVLPDAAHLQEEEATYANAKGFTKHHPARPLYTGEDAAEVLERFSPVPYRKGVEAAEGIGVELFGAGHIVGSASALVTVAGAAPLRLFFSGDVGRSNHPILRAPDTPPPADVFLVESTYGDRRHEPDEQALARMAEAITRTARQGGTVVIPSFAVDRTEVLLVALGRLVEEGRVPKLPIYADSPMALAVLDVYRRAIAARAPDIRLTGTVPDPFEVSGELHELRTPEESRSLNELGFPSIIISASGMATGGRVLHHLARCLPDSRCTVVLPGYQAEGTRGRQLADGARTVKLLGRYVPVRAKVLELGAFSVHADAAELVDWLRPVPLPDTGYLVHGERTAADAMAARFAGELGWNAVVPGQGERVRVDRQR
jgi:metallo-beta-lactamase family protein